ncbi:hypothetical protein KUTeg_015461 [Tegillarca granosa]|uniref:non-specific serine/threonine protein kinase n=1 Tax=Tegillarca granosa TaxID=220873 RepID=A0ABQ9EUW4_TEGGR|nr:hypothetical protein KUTeg_015461 [Tegillarca granosa]
MTVSVMKRSSESNDDSANEINSELPASQNKMQRTIRRINWELYHEAEHGNVDRVEELISLGAEVNNQDGYSKSSPLHIACKNAQTAVVKCLLGHNADVNLKDENEHTPLHVTVNNYIDKTVPVDINNREPRAREIVKLLIQNKADIHARDNLGRTPLHVCIRHPTLTEVLLNAGADCKLLDIKMRNPLHYVIDGQVAKVLCRAKTDLNLQDTNGRTPLHEASWYNRHEIVKVLLRAGSNIDIKDKLGNTSYQMANARASKEVVEMLRKWMDNKDLSDSEAEENDIGIPTEILQMDERSIEIYKKALRAGKEPDYTIRLMVVGPQGVGKTTLINRLLHLGLSLKEIESTNGIDIHVHRSAVNVDNGQWILNEEGKEDGDSKIKEHLLKVIDAIKSGSSKEIYGKISVWDFGGDFIFYTTHQTFLSSRGIYLVVLDISKTLFDAFKDRDCSVDISGLKNFRMGEYIVFWLNSIHTYASNNQVGVPPVILVATHLDKVQGDQEATMEDFFDKVRNLIKENGMSLNDHLIDDDFGVDNTKSSDDSILEELRQKIFEVAKDQKYWGKEKPASWITFEKILLEKQAIGIKILSFEEVMELTKELESGSINHEELDVFLKFEHAIGNLIYFSDLKEYVVLDPKWLINAFRRIITKEKFQNKMPPAIRFKWNELSKTAELRMELIDVLWKHIDRNYRKHLLGLMEKLDIIAKPLNYEEGKELNSHQELDYYFVPPMLKEEITDECLQSIETNAIITPNMYFVFHNHIISPSVYYRLIAACMKKWDIACQGKKRLLFCWCGIFSLDQSQTTRIMISMENYRIKVRVLFYHNQNDATILPYDVSKSVAVRKFVEETLKIIFGIYQQSVPYKLHLECTPNGGGLFSVDNLMEYPNINCTKHEEYCHPVSSRQLLKYWFHREVQSTQGLSIEVQSTQELFIKVQSTQGLFIKVQFRKENFGVQFIQRLLIKVQSTQGLLLENRSYKDY